MKPFSPGKPLSFGLGDLGKIRTSVEGAWESYMVFMTSLLIPLFMSHSRCVKQYVKRVRLPQVKSSNERQVVCDFVVKQPCLRSELSLVKKVKIKPGWFFR